MLLSDRSSNLRHAQKSGENNEPAMIAPPLEQNMTNYIESEAVGRFKPAVSKTKTRISKRRFSRGRSR